MSLTIARITDMAANGAQSAISDAVPAATLTRTTQGAYDAANGLHLTTDTVTTGRAVFQGVAPAKDMFPAYVVGPGDELILLIGFTSALENDVLTIGARTLTIMAVRDIGGAGTVWNVMAR